MIPRNIIQYWHDFNNIPKNISEAMTVTKNNNRNYSIIRADDKVMSKFIKAHYHELVLELYEKNRIPASRSDIARLMLLYEYGGFYIDASMELQRNLDELRDDTSKVILVLRDDAGIYKKCPERAHVINGFIAVPEKSEVIKWCIDEIISNMLSGKHNKRVNFATGPNIINQALVQYEELNIKKLKLTTLVNNFYIYRRVLGVNNSWVYSQFDGIIDPVVYKKSTQHYRKLWFFKRMAIHFSFDFLFLKK